MKIYIFNNDFIKFSNDIDKFIFCRVDIFIQLFVVEYYVMVIFRICDCYI